jgi:hypothetical protein
VVLTSERRSRLRGILGSPPPPRPVLLLAVAVASFAGAARAQTRATRSTAQQRDEVTITVYNQSFGLVREVRTVDLGAGKVSLELADVAKTIQPETVHVKSLAGDRALRVLEQNYRFDLLSPQTLLAKYVGRTVKVHRYSEKLGREETFDAEVLSVAQGTVLKIGGAITFDFPGRLSFPEVPPNLIARPTLVWLLDSAQAKQKVEVTYLARQMSWKSDYVLVVDDADARGDLTGWVTLENRSGAAYDNARLKLVAGDVQRLESDRFDDAEEMDSDRDGIPDAKDRAPSFKEESLFEYHLYTLQRPTTLLENEQKQVELLSARGLKVDKKLVFLGSASYFRGRYGQAVSNQKVGVYLDFVNSEQNRMGMPLPKGIVRVYKADKSGARQFVGEDQIDHTPRDEKIRIKMGEAFDVVGERRQTEWKTLGSCRSESAWEVVLRNHKDAPQAVDVFEPAGGDWEIVQSSHTAKKEDAHAFSFAVTVPKRGETKITYRLRVKWC